MSNIEQGCSGDMRRLAFELRSFLNLDINMPERQVSEAACRAIKQQIMCGTIALKFAESPMFTQYFEQRKYKPPFLFHGSPRRGLEVLEPLQAIWTYREPGIPLNFAHGWPAICASGNTRFPIIRALFHESRPELKDLPLVLKRGIDASGTVRWVTSDEALLALLDISARGSVYGFDNPDPTSLQTGYEYYLERQEYRVYGTRCPLVEIVVGMHDLPTDVYTIPAAQRDKLQCLNEFVTPESWAMHVAVPLGRFMPDTLRSVPSLLVSGSSSLLGRS